MSRSPAFLTKDEMNAVLEAAFTPGCTGIREAALTVGVPLRTLMTTLRFDHNFADEVQDVETLIQQAAREQLARDIEKDEQMPERTRVAIRRELARKPSPLYRHARHHAPAARKAEQEILSVPDLRTAGATVAPPSHRPFVPRPAGDYDWEAIQREIGLA